MTARARLVAACLLAACNTREGAAGAPPNGSQVVATRSEETPRAEVAASTSAGPPSTITTADPASGKTSWSFDSDVPGRPPTGFSFATTGRGRPGKWVVRAENGAPSGGQVLAQVDADPTDYRYPIAFAAAPPLANIDLSVRCKPVTGAVDQACGLVFRMRDANNYYLTRANAIEGNVRLYFVKDGGRQQIASWSGRVTTHAWHALRVTAVRGQIEVHFDGQRVIDHHDDTFAEPGRVGVWTKADSVTYFDDLTLQPL